MLAPLVGPETAVLTLQNGIDSADEVAAAVGEAARARRHDLRGHRPRGARPASSRPACTARSSSARRSASVGRVSPRVQAIADVMAPADIQVTPVADAPRAHLGQVRLPRAVRRLHRRGPAADRRLWRLPHVREMFYAAAREVAAIAAAEGVTISADRFADARPTTWTTSRRRRGRRCSSISSWASASKSRRCRAQRCAARPRTASPVPILSTLYAVLKPWAAGRVTRPAAGG